MDTAARARQLAELGVESRRFNPDQPRDFHGRWSLTGAVIAALKSAGGTQGGAHFDDGKYFDWSHYDPKKHSYTLEIGDSDDPEEANHAIFEDLGDYDLDHLYTALSVTRIRDKARESGGDLSPDLAGLAAAGRADNIVFEDGGSLDWSTRTDAGDYGFGIEDGNGNEVEFDLTPAEMDKLVASLALSTQSKEAVAAARARELALLGIEVRGTQSASTGSGQGSGGQTAHEPAGSSKGGQFTSRPSGSGIGYQSILPPASAYKSSSGAKKPAAVPAGTPQAPAEPRTMKAGDSGEDVRYAQYAMSLLGFKVAQDGNYGPETEAAVKQIQERLGVKKPNGHLSSAQLHKLQDAVRLSPCIGGGQRDLALEAQWEQRDLEDVDDVLDEDTEALIEALGEFVGSDERSFTEALHPRNPKGSAGGGRFRSIVDRVVDALSEWKKGNGPDDPLKDFNREQLMKAAKAHGHTFRRGASIEEIKAQILDDVRGGAKAEHASKPKLPGAPADHRRFTIQLGGTVAAPATGAAALDAPPLKLAAVERGATPPPGIDQGILQALDQYRGDAAGFRAHLTGRNVTERKQKLIAEVDRGMAASKLPRDVEVWRGLRSGQGVFGPRDSWPADLTGKEWTDPSYLSTSTSKTEARKFAKIGTGGGLMMRVVLPEGTGAVQVSEPRTHQRPGSVMVHESEILTERGLKLRVVRDHGDVDGIRTVDVEVVSPNAKKPSGAATDVGIFGNPTTGKLSLYRESDTGKRSGRAIKSFDDMAALESWARDNGHTELADYAKAEHARAGGAAKVAKAAPAKGPSKSDAKVTTAERVPESGALPSPSTTGTSNPLAGLEGLTPVQKRAALRKRGLSKAEIDALAPLEAKKAAKPALNPRMPTREGLPDPDASDAARQVVNLPDRAAIQAGLAGYNVRQLRAIATVMRLPTPKADDNGRPWTAASLAELVAKQIIQNRGRSTVRSKSLDDFLFFGPVGQDEDDVTRALSHDTHPGGEELHHYWTRGPGLAHWIGSPEQFRTLRAALAEATKGRIPPEELGRFAASWVKEVTGFWPGSDMHRVLEGGKPRGHRIGPG